MPRMAYPTMTHQSQLSSHAGQLPCPSRERRSRGYVMKVLLFGIAGLLIIVGAVLAVTRLRRPGSVPPEAPSPAVAATATGSLGAAFPYVAQPLSPTTEIDVYRDTDPDVTQLRQDYTGQKFEPLAGCYVGAYLEDANDLPTINGASGGALSRPEVFGAIIGKPLATTFRYANYGKPFPLEWAKQQVALGIAPHIAWEPNDGLDPVKDDAYLRQFARDARACGGKVFLRFASEMNGEWSVYSGNPALYREKWRLVHDVMEQEAPNVAMLWCVFTMPERNIPLYYPGDEYVDWVGVNIYNVYYHNARLSEPAWQEHATDLLRYVYHTFSSRKPIAIAEYGASHHNTVDNQDRSTFAALKLAQLLTALPRRFPRVKMINFFECNNIKYAPEGRRLNDYAISDNLLVTNTARALLSSDHFLSQVIEDGQNQQNLPTTEQRLEPGMVLSGVTHLSAWVKTNTLDPVVAYYMDGQMLTSVFGRGEYRMTLNAGQFTPGEHRLKVALLGPRGRALATREVTVIIQP